MTELFDFSEFPILETRRLRLREITEGDIDAIFAIFGDPEACKYLIDQDCQPYATPAQAKADVIDWCAQRFADKLGLRWALTLRSGEPDDGLLIGTAGFNTWHDKDRRADIGYDLATPYWGKGLMSEAVLALIDFGFERMGLHRIEADVTEGNGASMRVLEKCGFTHEGTWRDKHFANARYYDLEQYGLLRSTPSAE